MDTTVCRLRPLVRLFISSPCSRHLQAHRLFSSSSDDQSCRSRSLFFGESEKRSRGSDVYRQTLKTQRPPTIRWQKELENHASFIGRVNSPLKKFTTNGGLLCAHTHLKVESPSGSNRIFLDMWEDMAELCVQHLKPNDYIYVSGYLRSFTLASNNGNVILQPKVIVKEINYVASNNKNTNNIIQDSGESILEKHRKRLHLWQVFFTNPYEWRDLRKSKINPRQPDFKHRSSGEALWLKPCDPPWVMRQLRLQDSRMGGIRLGERLSHRSSLSPLSYDDNRRV
ncbi:protein OSB1, mitochondrial isoform X2 [Lactuca sativa]|uniref:protein OSB1, mitochondrial isoform X2 n=1 Tax=Lactuca sativa TaxID=4236 RepID=UPI000CD901D8|nr:protein OSB1, mitochondrial isoform X2 [Lactuca sativa]